MKVVINVLKPRSVAARMLTDRRYHHRVVRNKKKFSRKGRFPSKQKFEGFIQFANIRGLMEYVTNLIYC